MKFDIVIVRLCVYEDGTHSEFKDENNRFHTEIEAASQKEAYEKIKAIYMLEFDYAKLVNPKREDKPEGFIFEFDVRMPKEEKIKLENKSLGMLTLNEAEILDIENSMDRDEFLQKHGQYFLNYEQQLANLYHCSMYNQYQHFQYR